jgi:hypothetical protein
VLAPRLGNTRLFEDTHRWSQEESRRRGTLMSRGRAVVIQDSRGGGLQLMSNGDPALILSYCREYWDGASITHLSSADRKEVNSKTQQCAHSLHTVHTTDRLMNALR